MKADQGEIITLDNLDQILFGWLDASIALDNIQGAEGCRGIGNMECFEIALPSWKLSKYSPP